MKKILLTILVIVLAGAAIFWAATRNTGPDQSGKLQVAASFYPLYEFARQVGGDKVQVTNLTPSGAEPHDYEPSAKSLAGARDADLFIYNGGTFEPWVEAFLADYKNRAVRSSQAIELMPGEAHDHEGEEEPGHDGEEAVLDPHFWLDPLLAKQMVQNIKDGLIAADPQNEAYYTERVRSYADKLTALDEQFKAGLKTCRHDTIITSHSAFSYVAERYGLHMEPIAGLSPTDEPSAARLAELSDHVREEGLGYVFFESLVSPRLADTIANETGAETLVLDPIEGISDEGQKQGKDYIKVQQENLANLRTALECR